MRTGKCAQMTGLEPEQVFDVNRIGRKLPDLPAGLGHHGGALLSAVGFRGHASGRSAHGLFVNGMVGG